jgi:hypothetical protein
VCNIKNPPLFKRLKYFPPTLQIKHRQHQQNYDDCEIRGNREFVSKEFRTQFIIYYKMYKDTQIYPRLRNAEMFFFFLQKKLFRLLFMWSGVLFVFYYGGKKQHLENELWISSSWCNI